MKFPPITKKVKCRVPAITGWFLIFTVFSFSFSLFFLNIHQFLSENEPLKGDILAVEGWIPDYGFEEAVKIFRKGNYKMVVTTGGPLENGSYLKDYETYAKLGAATLKKLGIADSQIIPVSASLSRRDRTYQSALSLNRWMERTGNENYRVDLLTFSVHSRRSAFLFRKALKKKSAGVIAVENRDYNPEVWWKYSEGVRNVISEFIAYMYARVFFSVSF